MVGVLGAVEILAIVAINTVLTALMTRFFRVRMSTSWGSLLYAVLLCPVAMIAVVYVLSSLLPHADLGNPTAALSITVAAPLSLGIAFDYFWMPAPGEVDLPETMS